MSNPAEEFEENEDVPLLQDMLRFFAASNLSALPYGPITNPLDHSPIWFGYPGSKLANRLDMDLESAAARPVSKGMNLPLFGTFFIMKKATVDGNRYHTAPYNVTCNLWNTSYGLDVGFKSGDQSTEIRELRRLEPKHISANTDRSVDDYTLEDRAYAVYAIALFNMLETYIDATKGGIFGVESQVLRTSLGTCPELSSIISEETAHSEAYMCRNRTVFRAVEDLSLNFTLSPWRHPHCPPIPPSPQRSLAQSIDILTTGRT